MLCNSWDFMLHPVYSVNIVDFKLEKTRKAAKYASYVQLTNRDTHEVFFDKLTFVYLELPLLFFFLVNFLFIVLSGCVGKKQVNGGSRCLAVRLGLRCER